MPFDLATVASFTVQSIHHVLRSAPMIEFNIPSMSCGHCVARLTEAVKAADPSAKLEVDLKNKQVRVESAKDRAALAAALSEAGYPPN